MLSYSSVSRGSGVPESVASVSRSGLSGSRTTTLSSGFVFLSTATAALFSSVSEVSSAALSSCLGRLSIELRSIERRS